MSDLLIDRHEHISIFTLNRPEKMNSLGGTLSADLTARWPNSTPTRISTSRSSPAPATGPFRPALT